MITVKVDASAMVNEVLMAKLVTALTALDKIRDPRKRHKEPDKYTELGCVMNIADIAYQEIMGGDTQKGAPDVDTQEIRQD